MAPIDTLRALAVLSKVPRSALLHLLDAQDLRDDLAAFMKWAWPLSHRDPLVWNWHLGAITEHLQACKAGQITRLLINIPPRHLKSWTVSVAFPAWWWASDPTIQFLATSADEKIVLRDADEHRDLCKSEEYQQMFRPSWDFRAGTHGSKQEAKGYYRNSRNGHRISKPMGAKGTGHNADVILIDDPLDPGDAFNDKAGLAEHVVNYRQRIISRLNNPMTGVVVCVMQRLHELDLSGILIEEGGWEHICIPSEFDGSRRTTVFGPYDPRTEEGELLFPERHPQEILDKEKVALTARGFAGQHQQRPAPAKGAMVLRKWLEYWTAETLPQMDYVIGSWDCSFGAKGKDADYVVGQVWGAAGQYMYLLDQARERLSVPEMVEAVREQRRLWPQMQRIIIEEKAAGPNVMRTLMDEIPGIEGFDPGAVTRPDGKKGKKSQSKEERLHATLPMWEQHRIFLPSPMHVGAEGQDYAWVKNHYVRELTTFPAASHDDQVDATSQALLWMRDNGPGDIFESVKVLG